MNELVLIRGYRVWATMIEGQNAWAPLLSFALSSSDSQNTCDQITSDRRSKRVIKLRSVHSFILRRSSNTCRLYRVHTCDACIITTWRLGLWVTRGAHNNKLNMLLRSTAPNTKWLQTPVWDPPCHGNVNHKNLLHLWYSNKCLFFFFSRKEWVNKSLNVVQIMLTLLKLLC